MFRLNSVCNGLDFGKCLSRSFRQLRAMFVLSDLIEGGLCQMMFLARLHLEDGGFVEEFSPSRNNSTVDHNCHA